MPSPFAGICPPPGNVRNISPRGRGCDVRSSGIGGVSGVAQGPQSGGGGIPPVMGMRLANITPSGSHVVDTHPTNAANTATRTASSTQHAERNVGMIRG